MVSQNGRSTVWRRVAATLVAACLLLLVGRVVWLWATSREIHTLKGHAGSVWTVAFSPNGERLAAGGAREFTDSNSGSRDNLVMWDVKTGKRLHTYSVKAVWVGCVAFSPDGQRLAAAMWDGDAPVIVFAAGEDREIFRPKGLASGRTLAYNPDGTRLAAGDSEGIVKVWDATTGQDLLTLFQEGVTNVTSVAFSPDGTQLATYARGRGGVWIWNATTGAEIKQLLNNTLNDHNTISILNVAFSPDGKRLAAFDDWNGIVKVWNVDTGQEVLSLVHPPRDRALANVTVTFSSDGKWLASGGYDNTVRVWDAASGREWLTLRGHTSFVYRVAFSPDCKRIASASADGTVKVWRLSN